MKFTPTHNVVAVAALCLALTACTQVGGTVSQPGLPQESGAPVPLAVDAAAQAKLPAQIRSAGVIKVATDATYAPNEFVGPDNKTLQGMDIDLGEALGQVLGVKLSFESVVFDSIIPSLGTRYDIGMSSLNDTKEREDVVDMVDYFTAGASFMVAKGQNQDLRSLDALCGKRVAVGKGSVQYDDVAAQSTRCATAGRPAIEVQAYPDQNAANLAVRSGRADVGLADQPVIAFAVAQSNDSLEGVGEPYNTLPYGIAVPKAPAYEGLTEALQAALRRLAENGTYEKILEKWNLTDGASQSFTINGATS